MNIISNAGAVGSGVIVTKYSQHLSFFDDNFLDEGEEVVWILEGLIPE